MPPSFDVSRSPSTPSAVHTTQLHQIEEKSGVLFTGLWLFFLFLYLRPQDLFSPLQLARPVFILMGFLIIAVVASGKLDLSIAKIPFMKCLLIFLLLIAWSGVFSYFRGVSFFAFINFAKVVLACGLIILIIQSFKEIEKIFLLINFCMVFFAIDIGVKYLAGMDHGSIHGIVGAQFGNPNDLAVNFVLFLPMMYYYVLVGENRLFQGLALGLMGVELFAILGCQSRGGLLGAALVLGLLFLKTEKKALAIMAGVITLPIVLFFAPDTALDRVTNLSDYQSDGSADTRVMFYESSIYMMLDRPLNGVGIGAWPTAYAEAYRNPDDLSNRWPDPHSTYFQIIGELGLPGIIAYLSLIVIAFRSMKKMENEFRSSPIDYSREFYFIQCLRIGISGYLFCTIFQSFSYHQTLYNLMAFIATLELLSMKKNQERLGQQYV